MRADDAAGQDRAARAAKLDLVDAETDEPIVDQDLVARLEDLADHRRADGKLAVVEAFSARNDDLVAAGEGDGAIELADAELRALEVGDQRDRVADLGLGGAHQARALAVLVVGAVGEVQARAVHARIDQLSQEVGRAGGRADRGHDLRASGCGCRHALRVASRRAGHRDETESAQSGRAANASHPG